LTDCEQKNGMHYTQANGYASIKNIFHLINMGRVLNRQTYYKRKISEYVEKIGPILGVTIASCNITNTNKRV